MTIEDQYLDGILRKLYAKLRTSTDTFEAGKGKGFDLLAQTVVLKNPRARISATATRGRLISALAEFCWYMSGCADLEFVRFYIPHYPPKGAVGPIEDAYGPRLVGSGQFGHTTNQIDRVIRRLTERPDTRRAVISILGPDDFGPGRKEAPCTTALQFIRRRERIHLIAMMRSNDAYLGFPHDVFCFTMIQEFVARSLGVGVGEYHHFATSLHLYEHDLEGASKYLDEGYQNPTFAMPKMPSGCQCENLARFLDVERQIRVGDLEDSNQIKLPSYWRDLALVLLRYADTKYRRGTDHLEANFASISDQFYSNFFLRRPTLVKNDEYMPFIQTEFDLSDGDANEN
ncbi:thymidylate synthase [Maricaulis sp.]|uniref:thymidylate synthase n=1 Tax=Maricaulis sp. TaxID=1486257 RepID=UPI003A9399F7